MSLPSNVAHTAPCLQTLAQKSQKLEPCTPNPECQPRKTVCFSACVHGCDGVQLGAQKGQTGAGPHIYSMVWKGLDIPKMIKPKIVQGIHATCRPF